MSDPCPSKMIERARKHAKGLIYCASHDACDNAESECPCMDECPLPSAGTDAQAQMLGELLEEMADALDTMKDSLANAESLCNDWKTRAAAAESDCARFPCSTCSVPRPARASHNMCWLCSSTVDGRHTAHRWRGPCEQNTQPIKTWTTSEMATQKKSESSSISAGKESKNSIAEVLE